MLESIIKKSFHRCSGFFVSFLFLWDQSSDSSTRSAGTRWIWKWSRDHHTAFLALLVAVAVLLYYNAITLLLHNVHLTRILVTAELPSELPCLPCCNYTPCKIHCLFQGALKVHQPVFYAYLYGLGKHSVPIWAPPLTLSIFIWIMS